MSRIVRIRCDHAVQGHYYIGERLGVAWHHGRDLLSVILKNGKRAILIDTNTLERAVTDGAISAGARVIALEPPSVVVVECDLPSLPEHPHMNIPTSTSPYADFPADPDNAGWVKGWAVLSLPPAPWHLHGFYRTQDEAIATFDPEMKQFETKYGSHRLGSDDFIAD